MLLVEPLGLIHGLAASEAVRRGLALPLAGGPAAFSLVRLIGDPLGIVPVGNVPAAFLPAMQRLAAARAPWAALAGPPPWVMGVLNVTPDSFSDGGRHLDSGAAVAAGLAMHRAGADLVDVGGESTRPGAAPTSPEEEQRRVLPVIRGLVGQGIAVSVDTRHAATMQAALAAGAHVVNDVSALAHDPDAAGVVARAGAPVVLMHLRGTPQTMLEQPGYADVGVDVVRELAMRVAAALAAGIARDRIAVDPGIGFAKSGDDNLALLPRLSLLLNLGCHIVVGVSRKRFIGALTGEKMAARRDAGSLAAGLHAVLHGASVLRVHDVAETVQAMRVWRGLAGVS